MNVKITHNIENLADGPLLSWAAFKPKYNRPLYKRKKDFHEINIINWTIEYGRQRVC